MDSSKLQLIKNVQAYATEIATMAQKLEDLTDVYNSRTYGPGTADAITDDEMDMLEAQIGRKLSADDIYSFIILADQFKSFLRNGTPAQRDYAATVNKIRTDM